MFHIQKRVGLVLAASGLAGLASVAYAVGYLKAQATNDIGTFSLKLQGGGAISVVGAPSPVLFGSKSFKHTVPLAAARRAEMDSDRWDWPAQDRNYWYGFSYYVPNTPEWTGDIEQFVGQWRFNNQAWAPSTIVNCEMSGKGGSGHHLMIVNGNWRFSLYRPLAGVGSCAGLETQEFDLGPVTRGVWTSWIIQAKWRHTEDGFFKVWKRIGTNPTWYLKTTHLGRNWFDTYQAGSYFEGQKVAAPNYVVGLYWGRDAKARTLYTDQLRAYSILTAEETGAGFDIVKPEAPDLVVGAVSTSSTTSAPVS